MGQELFTLPGHRLTPLAPQSSPPVFSLDRISQSLVFCAMLLRSLFVMLSFFFVVIVLGNDHLT